MTPTDKPTQVGGLLPLPEIPVGHVHSDYEYCAERPFKNDGWPVSVYDADQMHAYAQANVQALEARLVALRDECRFLAEAYSFIHQRGVEKDFRGIADKMTALLESKP